MELTNELEQKAKEMKKDKQAVYDLGQKETAAHLKSQILVVCRDFCLWTWNEALNAVGVDPSSKLRNPEKVFYPLAIKEKTSAPTPLSTLHLPNLFVSKTNLLHPLIKAPTNSAIAKEISSSEKVPSLFEIADH
nr:hypothetical protein CFP56_10904 [Quercus suber]